MGMSIIHNMSAMNAGRMFNITNGKKAKSTEKLSSGYRINRAADDAAGLAISEKMRRQIRGLDQASRNIQDGISFCQTADGYLNEVHSILQRINELAVQSANETNSDTDRSYLDQEVQQLKQETRRIFKTAEFNEIKIWEMPYMPGIELDSDKEPDIQVFNSGMNPDGSPNFGGVEINHVRHTWEEMGVVFKEDGIHFDKDQTVEFENDYTGERVTLNLKDGDAPPQISRNYDWSANEEGIFVNNVKAVGWDELGIDEPVGRREISFTYHNMVISFETNDDDDETLQDVINGVNGGTTLKTEYTWNISSSGISAASQAVQTEGKRQQVTNANKDIIDNTYTVRADENGVTLADEDGNDHLFMSWGNASEDFTDGSFPISDWGKTGVDGKTVDSDLITFDDKTAYVYKDTTGGSQYGLPVEFSFTLQDETSLEAAIAALNGAGFSNNISAPSTISVSGPSVTIVNLIDDFEKQLTYGRDFDDPNATLMGRITRTIDVYEETPDGTGLRRVGSAATTAVADKLVYLDNGDSTYTVYNQKTDPVSASQYLKSDRTRMGVRYKYTGEFEGGILGEASEGFSYTRLDRYDVIKQKEYISYEATGETVSSVPEGATIITAVPENGERERTISETKRDTVYDHVYNKISFGLSGKGDAFELYFDHSDDILLDNVTYDITWKATDYAYRDFSLSPNAAQSREALFTDVSLDTPQRELYIQSGVEAGHGITLEWEPLNNAVIGIAGTNIRTAETAGAAIGQVKRALAKISEQRSDFGAYTNRLEHSYNIDRNTAENTQAAESVIRDTDMAKEMVAYSNHSVLEQAGTAMIANANQSKQGILSLLQ